jgi:hypothetical protein
MANNVANVSEPVKFVIIQSSGVTSARILHPTMSREPGLDGGIRAFRALVRAYIIMFSCLSYHLVCDYYLSKLVNSSLQVTSPLIKRSGVRRDIWAMCPNYSTSKGTNRTFNRCT